MAVRYEEMPRKASESQRIFVWIHIRSEICGYQAPLSPIWIVPPPKMRHSVPCRARGADPPRGVRSHKYIANKVCTVSANVEYGGYPDSRAHPLTRRNERALSLRIILS